MNWDFTVKLGIVGQEESLNGDPETEVIFLFSRNLVRLFSISVSSKLNVVAAVPAGAVSSSGSAQAENVVGSFPPCWATCCSDTLSDI